MTLQCPCGAVLHLSGTRSEVEAARTAFEARHAACPWTVLGIVPERTVEMIRGER